MNLFGIEIGFNRNGKSYVRRSECHSSIDGVKEDIRSLHKRITETEDHIGERINDSDEKAEIRVKGLSERIDTFQGIVQTILNRLMK